MCLVTNTPQFSIAEDDMLVFKVVRRAILTVEKNGHYSNEVVLTGCVYNAGYEYGKTYTEHEFGDDIQGDPRHDTYLVNKGYHSYTDYSNASIMAELLEEYDIMKRQHIVLKCVIPKGTPYYLSENGREMCSETLKVLEYPLQIPDFVQA